MNAMNSKPVKRERIEILKEVSPEELGQVISDYTDAGAKVTPQRQPSGRFDVEAIFEKNIRPEPVNPDFFKK